MAWDANTGDAKCYECGETGHYARHCPMFQSRLPKQEKAESFWRPGMDPPPPRRPASEIADAHDWAARIRRHMGWEKGDASAYERDRQRDILALQLEEVARLRAERES